ncbi:MAG: type II secretion system protein GspN [Myxococcota bacterium]
MAEKKTSLWKRIVGYVAFSLFALVVTFFLTFPYDALKDRVRLEADNAGYFLRIGKMGPGLFAVRASEVQVSKKSNAEPPPEAMKIDSVSIGPSLFPPGLAVKVNVLGGTVVTRVSGFGTTRIKVDADELDLTRGNLKGFSGIDFAGQIEAHVDLSIPRAAAAGNAPAEPDLSQASGTVSLATKALAINGGTANITIPQFGPEPAPVDLPKIVFGELTGKIKIDKGAATVEEFKSKSSDLELAISGTMKLAKRLEYAEPNLEIRLKPDPEFQKRLGMIGSAISFIGADPKDPTWRLGRLTGYLGRPQFR